MSAMEDAMRKTVETYVIEEKRLELQGVLGKGKFLEIIVLISEIKQQSSVLLPEYFLMGCNQPG